MPSGILSSEDKRGWFNATLFRKNITRFWPIWALYTAATFFCLPMVLLNDLGVDAPRAYLAGRVSSIVQNAAIASVFLGAFFGLLAAMALYSYLMDSRSVQLYHALPIRREGIFLTNWLSGLWFFLTPNLILFVISLAVEALYGVAAPGELVLWLLTATCIPMFFFCFAVCCAMFTGHILALPVFYGILNVLVVGVCALLDAAGEILLFNYGGGSLSGSTFARWCTPAWHLTHLLDQSSTLDGGAVTTVVCCCVVLGAVFTSIALWVYHARELERAGDIVTVGWVRPVFQYGLGVCVGLSLGIVLYYNFFEGLGPGAYIALVAVCAVLGAFAGRMLLKKTLRVFADGWKGPAALGVAVALLMAGVYSDFFGYQRRVPDAGRVEKVTITGVHTYPSDNASYSTLLLRDRESIEGAIAFHKALNAELDAIREFSRGSGWAEYWEESEDGESYETMTTKYFRITYTLTDGTTLERRYDPAPLYAEDLDDPASYTALLHELVNDPGVLALNYFERDLGEGEPEDLRVSGGWVSDTADLVRTADGYIRYLEGRVLESGVSAYLGNEITLTADEARTLWEAFRQDLAEGNVRRYLFNDAERNENCYISDIHISLTWTAPNEKTGERESNAIDVTFTPEKTEQHVMAALEELGLAELLQDRTGE